MFGLPFETAMLVFGFPLFWIAYTVAFLYLSRNWRRDSTSGEDGP